MGKEHIMGTPGACYYCGQLGIKKGTLRNRGRRTRGSISGRRIISIKCTEASNIIFPSLYSIQAQGKLSLWDPFSGLWKRPVCVPGLFSDCTDATDPHLRKACPQATPAPRLQTPCLSTSWFLNGLSEARPRGSTLRRSESSTSSLCMGLDPALLLSSSQGPVSDSTAHTLLLPNFSSSLPSCPAITWVEKGS